jgi:sarcosine oxidase, subunit gamma
VTVEPPLPDGIEKVNPALVLTLRFNPEEVASRRTVDRELGFILPLRSNTTAGDLHGQHALWRGPDEWLVVDLAGSAGPLERRLSEGLDEDPSAAVVDVTSAWSGYNLTGPSAQTRLEHSCPIDLHPKTFGPGRCVGTLLARTQVLIVALASDLGPSFRIYMPTSFSSYVGLWLVDAANL